MLWLQGLLTASFLWAPPHVNALGVDSAQNDGTCQCVALDYADSGSYLVDANAEGNFRYASMFEGNCRDNDITSTITGPTGREYQCSSIRAGYDGDIQISECTIPYAFMSTGKWQIVINLSPSVILIRTFTLTVSALVASVISPSASSTRTTTTLPQATVTTRCSPSLTQTVTARGSQSTTTETQQVIVRATGPRETLTSLTTTTVTPECRFPIIYTTRTTTPRPPTSTTPKPATTTAKPATTITILPSTTPAPTLPRPNGPGGGYYFTLSGSTCMMNLGAGTGPNPSGGPPQWITSLWRGGVPPALTTGGPLPTFVTCVKLPAATSTRKKRDAGAEGERGWETRVRAGSRLERRGVAATETVRVVVCQDIGEPAMVTVTATGRVVTVVTVETLTTVVTETVVVTATEKVVASGSSIDAAAASCWGEGEVLVA
ncbi:hypothetical protein B0T18DRAFT_467390 [Schizothecium vesticola]|uniref:Ig-like domain-containing protein n=1 Tax=Schizothecium vesticola TaxID=314040 RepID=A0AA40K209_9PEZI|nr:hypothetical protein B0T18DRAFT_467390 [Schizothecium vesticola]